ncbi:MAG: N-6 DNA methylase [Phycisphaerales bacterium]
MAKAKDRNRRLIHLLKTPNRNSTYVPVASASRISSATPTNTISRFAADAGERWRVLHPAKEVAALLAKLLTSPATPSVTPLVGPVLLLIRVAKEVESHNFALYGQESNGSTWALPMNMFLHAMDNACRNEWSNTITSPHLVEGDRLLKFNVVVANPPPSLDKWGQDHAENDPYNRFWAKRGIPPKSKGDYAFISHMIETAHETDGRVGIIVPHGVLFRGGAEGRFARKLIEDNLLEAVIGLPATSFSAPASRPPSSSSTAPASRIRSVQTRQARAVESTLAASLNPAPTRTGYPGYRKDRRHVRRLQNGG